VRLAIGPPWGILAFALLGLLELAVPIWAERSGRPTPWHPEHIAERYGLFTIIVLGECILAASTAVQAAKDAGGVSAELLVVAIGGLVLVFGLWWSYFKHPGDVGNQGEMQSAFEWGYGHYAVFAALAALGAGLQVATDTTHGATDIAPATAALTVAVPLVVYLVATALLHRRSLPGRLASSVAITTVLVLAVAVGATWLGVPLAVLAMGLLLAALVAVNVVAMQRGVSPVQGGEPG
jgi:low temperature requirement protein LtrA